MAGTTKDQDPYLLVLGREPCRTPDMKVSVGRYVLQFSGVSPQEVLREYIQRELHKLGLSIRDVEAVRVKHNLASDYVVVSIWTHSAISVAMVPPETVMENGTVLKYKVTSPQKTVISVPAEPAVDRWLD